MYDIELGLIVFESNITYSNHVEVLIAFIICAHSNRESITLLTKETTISKHSIKDGDRCEMDLVYTLHTA